MLMTVKSFLLRLWVNGLMFFFLFLLFFMELLRFPTYYTDRHNIETRQAGSHSLDWNFLLISQALKIIIHSGAGIRRQSGKIRLFILLKLILKLKKEALLLRVILIYHLLPILAPLNVSGLDEWLHAYSIKTESFSKFVNPETQLAFFSHSHLKIKPLSKSMSIGVLSHIEPILSTIDSNCSIQVSAFKLAVKDNVLAPKIAVLPTCLYDVAHIQFCLLRWKYLWLSWNKNSCFSVHSRGIPPFLEPCPQDSPRRAILRIRWAPAKIIFPLSFNRHWCALNVRAVFYWSFR